KLHFVFLPMVAYGHMIPAVDMAKLFVSRGLKVTVVTTPAFSELVLKARESGHDIGLRIIGFPPEGSPLKGDVVSMDQVTEDTHGEFLAAVELMRAPFEEFLEELGPDAVVSDMFLPWSAESAGKFGLPRLVFHGTSYMALCCSDQMRVYKPYEAVDSDSEPFILPNLPHRLEFFRSQLPPEEHSDNSFAGLRNQMAEAEKITHGALMNTFDELESDYARHYRNAMKKRAWSIGPLILCGGAGGKEELGSRGKKSAVDEHECMRWLDSKADHSVVYVCFGSMAVFSDAQLRELAAGLRDSSRNFVWVVRKTEGGGGNGWLPEGFEETTSETGMIIRGWAPQVLILNHPSVGAFVTHCGWNSTLEGIAAGVPMVTWPVFAEQFYNEKLIVDVLKIGVSVGSKKWQRVGSEGVAAEAVTAAVERVLFRDSAEEMRRRAKDYQAKAKIAVKGGGSSYNELNDFVEDIRNYKP
ncbi:hypothetical protein M569_00673, partial [Genlisea aurea]